MPMSKKQLAKYEARAAVIKAMAHPTRLAIIDELAEGERCVQDLTDLVPVGISTVSRHLASLRAAGITKMEKRGTQVFYSLRTPCVLKFMSCVESVLAASAKDRLACVR